MAKKEATLTHKVRNPQDLNSWLDIWTATVSADFGENNARTNETIVIEPSNNWQIQADKLGTIPVTKIVDINNIHNVTTLSSIEPNVLTKTDGNGNLVAGPTISTSDEDTTQFLNQKGVWADVNPPFTVDLEKITVNNQEEPTPNAEFKVGNKSVIVKPQGKLAFSSVVNNKTINLSLGPIGTEDIKEKTIKLGNLDLEGLNDPDNPNSGIEFILPLKNIADLPENSAKVTGMVKYGNAEESPSVWLTTAAGQRLDENNQLMVDENNDPIYNYAPDWGKIQTDHIVDSAVTEVKIADGSVTGEKLSDTAITDKFDTKLLGVWISEDPVSKDWMVKNFKNNNYWSYQDSVTYIIGSDNHEYPFDWNINVSLLNNKIIYNYNMPQWNNLSTEINLDEDKNSYENILSAYDLGILLKNYMDTQVQNSRNQPYSTFAMKTSSFKGAANNIVINNFNSNVDSEKIYPINLYKFTDWDYKHLGIWVEI